MNLWESSIKSNWILLWLFANCSFNSRSFVYSIIKSSACVLWFIGCGEATVCLHENDSLIHFKLKFMIQFSHACLVWCISLADGNWLKLKNCHRLTHLRGQTSRFRKVSKQINNNRKKSQERTPRNELLLDGNSKFISIFSLSHSNDSSLSAG